MNVQLVDSSVLTITHFVKNQLSGDHTVVLCRTNDQYDAERFIESFCKKIKQSMPMFTPTNLVCYCYDSQSFNCRKLHKHLSSWIERNPNQLVISERPDWHH